jgi:hypothetical protein
MKHIGFCLTKKGDSISFGREYFHTKFAFINENELGPSCTNYVVVDIYNTTSIVSSHINHSTSCKHYLPQTSSTSLYSNVMPFEDLCI